MWQICLPALVAESVRLGVDVMVTISTPAALAAKDATARIPIVMASVSQPVERGLVVSLAQPGGNLTGQSNEPGTELGGKQLEILKEAVPTLSRVGVFWNATFQTPTLRASEAAAQALGITVLPVDIQEPAHIDAAFATMLQTRPHGRRRSACTIWCVGCASIDTHSDDPLEPASTPVRHLPGANGLRNVAPRSLDPGTLFARFQHV